MKDKFELEKKIRKALLFVQVLDNPDPDWAEASDLTNALRLARQVVWKRIDEMQRSLRELKLCGDESLDPVEKYFDSRPVHVEFKEYSHACKADLYLGMVGSK